MSRHAVEASIGLVEVGNESWSGCNATVGEGGILYSTMNRSQSQVQSELYDALTRIIHGPSSYSRNPILCCELCQLINKQTVFRNPMRKRGTDGQSLAYVSGYE